jgi:hypothetical protein
MYRDLNLRIPEALFFHLERQAEEQGVSLEALCFSLLSGEKTESLMDPTYYQSMNLDVLRREIRTALEFQISRRYIR